MIEINVQALADSHSDLHKGLYTKDDIYRAMNLANGIVNNVSKGMYKEGYRNNIAVDFACACKMLGVDPCTYGLDELKPWLNNDEVNDLIDRLDVIEAYLNFWMSNRIWNYVLDESVWNNPGKTEVFVSA